MKNNKSHSKACSKDKSHSKSNGCTCPCSLPMLLFEHLFGIKCDNLTNYVPHLLIFLHIIAVIYLIIR